MKISEVEEALIESKRQHKSVPIPPARELREGRQSLRSGSKSPSVAVGRRVTRRSQISTALQEAATSRFVTYGFAATTIEEITADVGISRRTFFRYFKTKEELILSQFEDMRTMVSNELKKRPASEGSLQALRNSFKTLDSRPDIDRRRRLQLGALIDETPTLHGLMLLRQERWVSEIAQELAERLGRSPDDPDTRLVATIGYAAFQLAVYQSRAADSLDLAPAIDENFDRLDRLVHFA